MSLEVPSLQPTVAQRQAHKHVPTLQSPQHMLHSKFELKLLPKQPSLQVEIIELIVLAFFAFSAHQHQQNKC